MLRLHRVVLSSVVGITLAMSMLAEPVLAAAPSTKATYTVVAGDYLSGIALKLNVSMSSLLKANELRSTSVIVPGQQLVVPGRTSIMVSPSTTAAASTSARYTVASGDFLTGIADTLGVSVRALLTANDLTLNSVIHPGMTLVVPKGGSLPAAPAPKPAAAAPTAPKPKPTPSTPAKKYTVVSGDSLSGIADKVGVSLGSLLSANQLSASSLIYPGMLLQLPKGARLPVSTSAPAAPTANPATKTLKYTVVSGDSLSGVAAALGVGLSRLMSANKLTTVSVIVPGMQLTVPAGGHLPVAASPTANEPASAPGVRTVVEFARAQIGKPYKFNTAGPDTFDCSGLVLAAFEQIGTSLPHYSGAQIAFGTAVDWTTEPIKAGDLVFLESAPGTGVVNHVGIATSATTWVQAPRTGDVVREGRISTTRIVGVRRLIGA